MSVLLRTLRRIAPEARPDRIDPAADLRSQLDLDSMDFLNFVIGVSEATGVEIPESDYGQVASLERLVAYVDERAAKPGEVIATPDRPAPAAGPRPSSVQSMPRTDA